VFTDNTGVRSKATSVQTAARPRTYLFARNANDMTLWLNDDMYDMAQPN
jgi:hypothetical protein